MIHDSVNLAMYAVLYPDNAPEFHVCDIEPIYRMKYFVITDLSSDHLPWDYIIDNGLYMEKVASCNIFSHDFIRKEIMKIYLTYNLWTCSCHEGKFIHPVEKPLCMICKTYHHKLHDKIENFQIRHGWHASTDIYPYWHEIVDQNDLMTNFSEQRSTYM